MARDRRDPSIKTKKRSWGIPKCVAELSGCLLLMVVGLAAAMGLGLGLRKMDQAERDASDTWFITEVIEISTGEVVKEYRDERRFHSAWVVGEGRVLRIEEDTYPADRYRVQTRKEPR